MVLVRINPYTRVRCATCRKAVAIGDEVVLDRPKGPGSGLSWIAQHLSCVQDLEATLQAAVNCEPLAGHAEDVQLDDSWPVVSL